MVKSIKLASGAFLEEGCQASLPKHANCDRELQAVLYLACGIELE